MSQEEDKNPTAADRQVTLEGEEAEILAGMANQSTEVETLRTELLNAKQLRRKVQLLSPFPIPQNQSLQIPLLKLLRLRQRTFPC